MWERMHVGVSGQLVGDDSSFHHVHLGYQTHIARLEPSIAEPAPKLI